jgi:hypothetical protein
MLDQHRRTHLHRICHGDPAARTSRGPAPGEEFPASSTWGSQGRSDTVCLRAQIEVIARARSAQPP